MCFYLSINYCSIVFCGLSFMNALVKIRAFTGAGVPVIK